MKFSDRSNATNIVLGAALLAAAALSAYWPALHGGFIWDDDVHVTSNPSIVGPLGLASIWTTSAAVYYPLTLTSFWIQHVLWGLDPLPYHVVSLSMHTAAALLLWRVLVRLAIPGALFGAALWALHPIQVESVAWITELKNTQSGVFYLAAILFFLRWIDRESHASPYTSQWNYALALVAAVLAILSKTSTVMLPVVLVLCWWWKSRDLKWSDSGWMTRLAPFFLISLIAGAWTVWEQQHHSGALGAEWTLSWAERVALSGKIVWFYLGKLLWPDPLIFIYPRWAVDSWSVIEYLPAGALALALLLLWRGRNGPLRPVCFAFAYFVVSLFPVSGFFNVYFFRYSFVADHFQYLAAMGPLVLAVAGIATAVTYLSAQQQRRRVLIPALCAALLVACGILSRRQSAVYASSLTLWRDTIAKNPSAWMAHTNLGAELDDQGRFDEAISSYEAALRINPEDAGAHNNLATHLARLGRLPEAIKEWEHALRIQPHRAEAHTNVAFALAQLGRQQEAFEHWEQALKLAPDLFEAHQDYGIALTRAERLDDAIAHLEQAIRLKPDSTDVRFRLASALKRQGNYENALRHLRRVVDLEPRSVAANNALAWMLATCPEASLRNGLEGVQFALRAAQFSGGTDPGILDTLAAAYAESGDFVQATETVRRALNLLGEASPSSLEGIRGRLSLFMAKKAYREEAP